MKSKMKRLISLLLCLLLLSTALTSSCLAAKTSGKCGKNATWSYNKKKKILTISGKGAIRDTWSRRIGDTRVTVVIKEGITAIGKDAFSSNTIRKLSLPQSLTTIGAYAFCNQDCTMPSSVTIPKNVKKIGRHAFNGSEGLKSIKVEKGNPSFSSKDGVLFNKNKTTLICCPSEKSGKFTIPDGVKTLEEFAFQDSILKELTVPASVKKIKGDAFYGAGFELVFLGHIPSGLAGELEDEDLCYIEKVTYPRDYEEEWDAFSNKLENSNIKWYYWWYED